MFCSLQIRYTQLGFALLKKLIIYTFNAESFQGMLQLIYHTEYLQITNPVCTRILQILTTEEKTKLRT